MNADPLFVALRKFSGAVKKTGAEMVADGGRRFLRIVRRETPPLGRFGKRKGHTAWLKARIIGMRLPRGKIKRGDRNRHMSKKEAAAYFREAMRRQGEMLSGWNALGAAVGMRPAQWIARHGQKHGRVRVSGVGLGTRMRITFIDGATRRRFDMGRFVRSAAERVERGIAANARYAAAALARRSR